MRALPARAALAALRPVRLPALVLGLCAVACSRADEAGGSAGVASAPGERGASVDERPNVLLITVDTLRADHLSLHGYRRDTSPFLSELAAQGVVFDDVVSQCGTTPQSLSSLMTGLYPFTDRILTQNGRFAFLRSGNRTLARILSEAGYETHAVTSQIQTARVTGLDLGFQSFDGVELGADNKQEPNRAADEMTDRALAWLRARPDPARPFFLWLHYLDPHHPYKPPARYDALWSDEEPGVEGETRHYRYDPKGSLDLPVSDGELARLTLAYDREIRFTDDELRRLFDEGFGALLERTVVLFSADHGESLGEHGMIGHNDLFEPILGVPLILRLPGPERPRGRSSAPVMLVDLFPTILELTGVGAPDATRGTSLLEILAGEPPEGRWRLAEYPRHQAIYLDDLKLMKRKTKTLLFDVGLDAAERVDLAGERGALVRELDEQAERWKSAPLFQDDAPEPELPAVSPEMLEELEALGYGAHGGG